MAGKPAILFLFTLLTFLKNTYIIRIIYNLMKSKIRINGNKNIAHDKIKAKLGLTDKKNHSVFYLEGGTFITPENDLDDFVSVMNDIESSCKRSIKKKLLYSKLLDTNFLMNFEICSDRMKMNKNSYLSFQYHFKQKNGKNENIFTVKEENELFFNELLNDIENELNNYKIKLSKKRNN